jgi:large subunit ribosomal protein L17
MQKGNSQKKFGRVTKQRKALIRSLAVGLIANGKILTTEAKAKALRPHIEKLVTISREKSVVSMRKLSSELDKKSVNMLINDIGPKFQKRDGGYTRIIKMPVRISDNSKMATIEFVQ